MHPARVVLKNLEDCFSTDELEVLIAKPPASYSIEELVALPVKVIHKPSGREVVGHERTQIKSKISALLQLIAAELDDAPHGEP